MIDVKRVCIALGACVGFSVLASDCSPESAKEEVGTETHWLSECSADQECDVGRCLCGLCTFVCATPSDCDVAPKAARCVAAEDDEYVLRCPPSISGICLEADRSQSATVRSKGASDGSGTVVAMGVAGDHAGLAVGSSGEQSGLTQAGAGSQAEGAGGGEATGTDPASSQRGTTDGTAAAASNGSDRTPSGGSAASDEPGVQSDAGHGALVAAGKAGEASGDAHPMEGAGGTSTTDSAGSDDAGRSASGSGDAGAGGAAGAGSVITTPEPTTSRCRAVLLDNVGVPADYPVLLLDTPEAQARFEAERDRFYAANGASNAPFMYTAISYSPQIRNSGALWVPLGDPPVSDSDAPALVAEFLAAWPTFFNSESVVFDEAGSSCSRNTCYLLFDQDYCGLTVTSVESDYSGWLRFDLDQDASGMVSVYSYLVPMVSIPRHVLLREAELEERVLGTPLSWLCADGEHTAEVTAADAVAADPQPLVYVRRSPDHDDALEYRLAVGVDVDMVSAVGSWTIYVDGIDGTIIDLEPHFICD